MWMKYVLLGSPLAKYLLQQFHYKNSCQNRCFTLKMNSEDAKRYSGLLPNFTAFPEKLKFHPIWYERLGGF